MYPADLVKCLYDILRVSAQPIDVCHLILDGLYIIPGAKEFLEPFPRRVQLVFDATLQF